MRLLASLLFLALAGSLAATPRFEDYPVPEIYKGERAAVDTSNTSPWRPYRSNLRRAQEKGPNFAGRYTIAQWNCGLRCTQIVVLDTASGKIAGELETQTGVHFRLDSELLIANPPISIPKGERKVRTRYYRWTAGAFEELPVTEP